jgi:hypothetical protein
MIARAPAINAATANFFRGELFMMFPLEWISGRADRVLYLFVLPFLDVADPFLRFGGVTGTGPGKPLSSDAGAGCGGSSISGTPVLELDTYSWN